MLSLARKFLVVPAVDAMTTPVALTPTAVASKPAVSTRSAWVGNPWADARCFVWGGELSRSASAFAGLRAPAARKQGPAGSAGRAGPVGPAGPATRLEAPLA